MSREEEITKMEEGHCGEYSRIADQNSSFCASNEMVLITQKVLVQNGANLLTHRQN